MGQHEVEKELLPRDAHGRVEYCVLDPVRSLPAIDELEVGLVEGRISALEVIEWRDEPGVLECARRVAARAGVAELVNLGRLLGATGGEEARSILRERLRNLEAVQSADRDQRLATLTCACALLELSPDDEWAAGIVIRCLASTDSDVRHLAAVLGSEVFRPHCYTRAMDRLREAYRALLQDPDPWFVLSGALNVFAAVDPEASRERLVQYLEAPHRSDQISFAVMLFLDSFDQASDFACLLGWIRRTPDRESAVIVAARHLRALVQLDVEHCVALAIEGLEARSALARLAAVQLLEGIELTSLARGQVAASLEDEPDEALRERLAALLDGTVVR